MKKFKSLFLAAALVLGFAACSNEGNEQLDGTTYVAIRVDGVRTLAATGAVETGATLTVNLNTNATTHGTIVYVLNNAGGILHRQDLSGAPGAQTILSADGGVTNLPVQVASQIYVVANVPVGYMAHLLNTTAVQTLNQIHAAVHTIATQTSRLYPALANVNAQPVLVSSGTVAGGFTNVGVNVSPVISRLEVGGVTFHDGWYPAPPTGAAPDHVMNQTRIISADVTGVWLNNTWTNFRFDGTGTAARSYPASSTPQTAWLTAPSIVGTTWSSNLAGVAGPVVANANNVWAFNVASGILPRFVVRVENIVFETRGALNATAVPGVLTPAGPRFVTVTGYTNITHNAAGVPDGTLPQMFTRGNIYQILAEDFVITMDNLNHTDADPAPVHVRVTVTPVNWVLRNTTPIF